MNELPKLNYSTEKDSLERVRDISERLVKDFESHKITVSFYEVYELKEYLSLLAAIPLDEEVELVIEPESFGDPLGVLESTVRNVSKLLTPGDFKLGAFGRVSYAKYKGHGVEFHPDADLVQVDNNTGSVWHLEAESIHRACDIVNKELEGSDE